MPVFAVRQVYKKDDNVQIVRDNKSPKMIGTIERFEVDEPNLADNESGDANKSFVVVRPIGGNNVSRQAIQCTDRRGRACPARRFAQSGRRLTWDWLVAPLVPPPPQSSQASLQNGTLKSTA